MLTDSAHRRPSPVLLAPVVAALLGAGLSGCAALGVGGETASSGSGTGGDAPVVAAAFYPLAFVAERVGGDRAEVTNLTTPGGEPHDLDLGVGETALVAEADLVVLEEGFQPAVDAAAAESATGAVLDATDVVELRPVSDEHDHAHGEEDHADEEHEGESHEGEEHEEHAHEEGGLDPHFWLDPLLMADLADAVAEELAALDPAGAEAYAANAADLRAELERLDAAYAEGLADCARELVVVNHDAFGYLSRYGLHFEPITGLSPDAEPTPGDLARLQDLIRQEGVTTVFSESLVSPETAETLAGDLGIEADVLDPLEGLTDATAGEDYLSLMRQNLSALQAANGC